MVRSNPSSTCGVTKGRSGPGLASVCDFEDWQRTLPGIGIASLELPLRNQSHRQPERHGIAGSRRSVRDQ
jgi:hypothetical protein